MLAAVVACAFGAASIAMRTLAITTHARSEARRITWADMARLHPRLEAAGITSTTFASYVERAHESNARRIREGDLDHLIFYALQSTHVASSPPIEPALSAKAVVDSLDAAERETFLKSGLAPRSKIPASARLRLSALLRAVESSDREERLASFRALVDATFPVRREREPALLGEYLRVMRFVYEKEFVAQKSPRPSEAVAELYRTRGLSTDTAVESGYLVYLGLGVVKSLEPARRIHRVLIVGPGLDLAPRTAMLEAGPPESYQPWAIIDALFALGLSRAADLEVVAADINPRVVAHLRRSRTRPPALILVSEIGENGTVSLSQEFREYFAGLGAAIGDAEAGSVSIAGGHRRKTVRVHPAAARVLRSEALDVVTERLDEAPFDIIIATNILPYFNDVELMLAVSNIAGMLAPGGLFLHNEPRPAMLDVTSMLGLRLEQSRQAVIATAPTSLVDVVWLHRKAGAP